MRKTSMLKKKRILELLFEGLTYGQVAKILRISKSTVKMVYDEFVAETSDSSLEEAAEKCGISEEIEVLRELAFEARRSGLSVQELLASAKLSTLMKKLGVSAPDLQEFLDMCEKHRQDFGDFIEAALKLHGLEKETGRSYGQIIMHYKKTKVKLKELEKQLEKALENLGEQEKQVESDLRDLLGKCNVARNEFEKLSKKSSDARQVLNSYERTKKELTAFGLQINDFKTVNKFLSEIRRLGGKPTKAMKILEEVSLFEAKLQEQKLALDSLRQTNKEETRLHNLQIKELETKEDRLEREIDARRKTLDKFKTEVIITTNKLEKEFTSRKEQIWALEQLHDGLLKRQADMLQVQPDIDSVREALPKRKKELEELERKIEEDKMIIAGTTAISNLLSKKPSNRNAIIQFLQMTKSDVSYTSLDETARQKIVEIMAEQGYVPEGNFEIVKTSYEKEIAKCNQQTKMWLGVAKIRLDDLKEFRAQLEKIRDDWGKTKDKQTTEKLANLITEVAKKVNEEFPTL